VVVALAYENERAIQLYPFNHLTAHLDAASAGDYLSGDRRCANRSLYLGRWQCNLPGGFLPGTHHVHQSIVQVQLACSLCVIGCIADNNDIIGSNVANLSSVILKISGSGLDDFHRSGCSINHLQHSGSVCRLPDRPCSRGSEGDPFAVCHSVEQLTHLRKSLHGDIIHVEFCGNLAYVHRKSDPGHHLIHRVLQVRKDWHQLVTPYQSGGVSAHKESGDQSVGRFFDCA